MGKPGAEKKDEKVGPGHCTAVGCKATEKTFSFCEQHFDWFKFGLLKKSGERVMDFDKKVEHYNAHRVRRGLPKVA